MGITAKTVVVYVNRIMEDNGYPNRVILAVHWDRQQNRSKSE